MVSERYLRKDSIWNNRPEVFGSSKRPDTLAQTLNRAHRNPSVTAADEQARLDLDISSRRRRQMFTFVFSPSDVASGSCRRSLFLFFPQGSESDGTFCKLTRSRETMRLEGVNPLAPAVIRARCQEVWPWLWVSLSQITSSVFTLGRLLQRGAKPQFGINALV